MLKREDERTRVFETQGLKKFGHAFASGGQEGDLDGVSTD